MSAARKVVLLAGAILAAALPVSAWGNAWSPKLQKNVGPAKLQASIIGIHNLLDEASVRHVFIDGTVLGLQRDGVPIPHDDDVDVVVQLKDLETVAALVGEQATILEPRWHTIKVFYHAPVDIYAYYSVPEGLCLFEDSVFVNETMFWPPVLSPFPLLGNISLPIPQDIERFLTYRYGSGWRTPSSARTENDSGFAEYCQAEGERLAANGMDFGRFQPAWVFKVGIALIVMGGSMSLVMSSRILKSRWPQEGRIISSAGLIVWYIGLCVAWILFNYNESITRSGHFAAPKLAILCYLMQIIFNLGVWRLWDGKFTELPVAVRKSGTGLLKYCGPAMLYALVDVLLVRVLQSIDFLARDMLMQFRLMPLAFVWQRTIGSGCCRLSRFTCIGLLFICLGRVALHHMDNLPDGGIRLLGAGAVVSTAATLLHEKLLKSQAMITATSLQNLALSMFGTLCSVFVWTIVEVSGSAPKGSHVFNAEQWEELFRYTFAMTPYPLLWCLFVSLAQMTKSYVLRDTSAVTADVCASAGALLMTPLTSTLFHGGINFEVLGAGLMLCGIGVYFSSVPWKAEVDHTHVSDVEEVEEVEPKVCGKPEVEDDFKLKNVRDYLDLKP